jgi:GTPase SAR1 family protein
MTAKNRKLSGVPGDGDSVYTKQLRVLQEVNRLAGGSLDLPRIAVVGDQSSGKSSLLGELTGVRFPVKSGICTKAAINVVCKHNAKLKQAEFRIQIRDEKSGRQEFVRIAAESLGDKILEVQKNAIYRQAEALGSKPPKISNEEILLRVEGPNQLDIILTDLPGIINDGDGKEETRELIRR